MYYDPEKEYNSRRHRWWQVKGLAYLIGLTISAALILAGTLYLAYWTIRGIL